MDVINRTKMKKEDIIKSLNSQQQAPVINYKGASFVLSVPGSGKTRVLTTRTQYMILDGVNPKNILMFTFTKKAANEMRDRVKKAVGEATSQITIRTYHSFCGLMLRKYANDYLEGFNSRFSIFDSEDKKEIIRPIAKKYNLDNYELESTISFWKDHLMSPQDSLEAIEEQSDSFGDDAYNNFIAMSNAYKEYASKMRSLNAMDFDDLLYYTIYILENYESVRKQMYSKYKYIMNDEAQDSNDTNLRLIELIANPDDFNVCCVGDIDQSIYAFRGSDVEAVQSFIDRHNMNIYELGQNYRSTQTIFNAARSVIRNNGNEFQEEPFTCNEMGDKIMMLNCKSTIDEASTVARLLMAICEKKNLNLSEFAILYRTSYQSRVIEECMLKNGIPYTITGGTPFYSRKEIKDLLAYIRFINNPHDQIAFERILQIPKRGLGQVSISKIMIESENILNDDDITSCIAKQDGVIIRLSEKLEKWCSSNLKGNAKVGFLNFLKTIRQVYNVMEEDSPCDTLKYLVDLIQYNKYLEDYCSKHNKESDSSERMENIKELIEMAATFQSIDEFLQSMMLVSEISDVNENEEKIGKINLMTMHAAKGLEFDCVFIVGMNESTCPHYRSKTNEDIKEERRLFYVAMTRARKYLVVSRPINVMVNGISSIMRISRFVNEIDNQYLQVKTRKIS